MPPKRRADEQVYEDIREIATMKEALSNTCAGIARIEKALFDDKGIEPRLRNVEIQQGRWKGMAAGISALVSAVTTGVAIWLGRR